MAFFTNALPLVVSVIKMVSGVIEYVKSALVLIFGSNLKSRLIAWDCDIEECSQMNIIEEGIWTGLIEQSAVGLIFGKGTPAGHSGPPGSVLRFQWRSHRPKCESQIAWDSTNKTWRPSCTKVGLFLLALPVRHAATSISTSAACFARFFAPAVPSGFSRPKSSWLEVPDHLCQQHHSD